MDWIRSSHHAAHSLLLCITFNESMLVMFIFVLMAYKPSDKESMIKRKQVVLRVLDATRSSILQFTHLIAEFKKKQLSLISRSNM